MSKRLVLTIVPQAVLATQFKEFEKSPITLTQWSDLLGTGVFNANGELRNMVIRINCSSLILSAGDMWKYVL